MAATRTKAEETYREEIAAYLRLVQELKAWTQAELGRNAGYSDHTAVNKALKGRHTMAFDALLALETASGVTMPQELRDAAVAARQPRAVGVPPADTLKALAEKLLEAAADKPKADRDALAKALKKLGV